MKILNLEVCETSTDFLNFVLYHLQMTNLHPEKVVRIPPDPDPQQTGAPSKVLNWKGDEKKTKK